MDRTNPDHNQIGRNKAVPESITQKGESDTSGLNAIHLPTISLPKGGGPIKALMKNLPSNRSMAR
jgi:hypothetical protein